MENIHDLNQKINLYLDNALPEKDQIDLLSQVDNDPKCCSMLKNEESFRKLIKNNVKCNPVSQEIIQSIRERIKYQ